MIELKNVSKFYTDNSIVTIGLRNINLKFTKGEFVAITGDSGCGKSTLLNVISLIDTYDEGEILYYGNETFYFNQNESDVFRKNNISFIFQKYNIVDSYTVLQNVMLPLLIKGTPEEEAKKEALEIIKKVGLEHRTNNKGTKLSGGEKQRCVIARAIANNAPVLACDEPTGNLDKKTSEEIIKLIKEVSKDKLVLIVTHDYESIKNICTRKIKLSDGEVVEDITFEVGIDEEEKDVSLVDSRPSIKTLFKLAFLNIFSTPKKTIFSTLVFSFVCLILLLLSLFMIQLSYNENYTYNKEYGIISEDRMIIYDDKHNSLDMVQLEPIIKDSEYYTNAFYEEKNTDFKIGDQGYINAAVTFKEMEYELLFGSNDILNDEFVLVFAKSDYYINIDETYIGEEVKIKIYADDDYFVSIGKLAGVAVSNEIHSTYLVGKYNEKLTNIVINNDVTLSFTSTKSTRTIISKMHVVNAPKTYIAIPNSLKDDIEFNFNIQNLYPVSYDIEVVYTDEVNYPIMIVNQAYLNGEITPKFDGIKEITVYTDNVKNLSKKLTKLGYDVSIPSMVENNNGASLIVLYMAMGLVIVALIIMFYISFAIIQRIYLTKTKDYSIFRTLGLISKDIKKILNIEVVFIALFSTIIGAILTNLIIIISKTDLYKYMSLYLIIFYLIAMSLFALLTSNRLNSKIFKYSVYQSIKEGSE
ncbi:MAG: ATP-binding cassette domain-containing protein [Erysipelotrichaceae bacterium]|nr:ATP-binding cassette domain-containing protein [Erysipelotrichaceae bacterium]